ATGPGALTLGGVTVSNALTAALRAAAANVTVTVTGGAVSATQDAFLLDDGCASCTLKVTGASFSGGLMSGHAVEITAKATGSQVTFENDDVHGDTSVLDATATLSVSGSTFKENGTEAESMINFAGQTIDVTSSSITLSTDNFGINLSGGTLTTSGLTIQGGNYGIYQLSGNTKLRDTKISGYVFMGFYLAQGALDLGTAMDRGGNAFSTGTTGALVFGLYVDGVTRPVTSSNTTFNGVEPPAGTQAAPATDPIAVTGEYFINDGTTMSFWTL
ncbi:MAG TPA: hypothetical protein VH560_07150, partial [Polyangia bacterium]|nr:hypothetical protein [Polyangia bacterium]